MMYDRDFYAEGYDEKKVSAALIVKEIIKVLPFFPNSVVDLGCGTGIFLKEFKENGVKMVKGFDESYIDSRDREISLEEFVEVDLNEKVKVDKRVDLAISLEVAEHLEPSHAKHFVENLTEFSDRIVFSAAVPGQGGVNHINEQWQDYWQKIFASYGYTYYSVLRDRIWNDRRISYFYRQNIAVYIKEKTMDSLSNVYERGGGR